ncbi:MAG: lipid-A-disaccharide synthase [Bacteroidales bacterium]
MRYYIIAGEASGDLHGSNLIKQLSALDEKADFRFWGGNNMMEAAGKKAVKHIKELAFMGFLEVLLNLRTILSNITFCKKDILKYQPDALILIDYPGFNLRIAKFAKAKGIKVIYYISPQIWAWKQSRVKSIKKNVDKMLVILPFEREFYEKFGFEADFVGHPLIDAIEKNKLGSDIEKFKSTYNLNEKPIVALLPGSRKQEISKMLNIMAKTVKYFPDYQFVIAGLSGHPEKTYRLCNKEKNIRIIYDKTYELLNYSYAAFVTSGTATLETALFNVPQIVCYKGGLLSYLIAKRLVKINFISLVNIIMNKEVVKELIQNDFNVKKLTGEARKLLYDKQYRQEIMDDYKKLEKLLGGKGASENAANLIYKYLK